MEENKNNVLTSVESSAPKKRGPKKNTEDTYESVKKVTREKSKNLHYQRDRDRELVKGKFMNHETPGGAISFSFRKYKEDKVEKFTFEDGKIYQVPRGVALHIANGCWYPEHYYKQDASGKPSQEIGMKKKRFSFIPLDFIIDDEFENNRVNNIITMKDL
jgi:hypothetical protein